MDGDKAEDPRIAQAVEKAMDAAVGNMSIRSQAQTRAITGEPDVVAKFTELLTTIARGMSEGSMNQSMARTMIELSLSPNAASTGSFSTGPATPEGAWAQGIAVRAVTVMATELGLPLEGRQGGRRRDSPGGKP